MEPVQKIKVDLEKVKMNLNAVLCVGKYQEELFQQIYNHIVQALELLEEKMKPTDES